MELYVIFWIVVGAVISIIPAYFIKKYNITKNYIWLFLSMICYCILMLAYSKLFVSKNIVTIYQIIKILSVLLATVFGYLFLSYKLTIKTMFGVIFAIMSIYLLS